MNKAVRKRVERLEEAIPPKKSPSQQTEDLSGWIQLLDNWPERCFCKNIYKTPEQIAQEIEALRAECRDFADRVRSGEFTNADELLMQVPKDALLGMRAYFLSRQGETKGEDHLRSPHC